MIQQEKTYCTLCRGSGWVFAYPKKNDSGSGPFAFRCACSQGRAKWQTSIPLWNTRWASQFDPFWSLQENLETAEGKAKLAEKKADADAIHPIAPDEVITLTECLEAAKRGVALTAQDPFRALIKKHGQETVQTMMRSIRLKDQVAQSGLAG